MTSLFPFSMWLVKLIANRYCINTRKSEMTLGVESWFLSHSPWSAGKEDSCSTFFFFLNKTRTFPRKSDWRVNIVLGFLKWDFVILPSHSGELIKGKDHVLIALYTQCPTSYQAYSLYLTNVCERKKEITLQSLQLPRNILNIHNCFVLLYYI